MRTLLQDAVLIIGKAVLNMNWCDYVVIGIIGVFALIGLFKGFIMSVYRLVSFVVCIFLSIKLSPVLARYVEKTPVFDRIKGAIVSNLEIWSKNALSSPQAAQTSAEGTEKLLGTIPMPEIFKSSLLKNVPSPSELIDVKSILDAVGSELAGMIISVLCLIVLYFVLRLIFYIAGKLLRGISELPVFKQINKLGGLILGALQGVLAVYILCAVLVLFNSNPGLAPVFEGIESSAVASGFYGNNFIVNFLFPPVSA